MSEDSVEQPVVLHSVEKPVVLTKLLACFLPRLCATDAFLPPVHEDLPEARRHHLISSAWSSLDQQRIPPDQQQLVSADTPLTFDRQFWVLGELHPQPAAFLSLFRFLGWRQESAAPS